MNLHLQKSLHILGAFFLHIPTSIHAEDIDSFEDDDFSLPTITSASRLSESVLSSPSSVTVIDKALIEASGFIELADLMRLVPGFIVSHAYGGNMAVISHGEGWEFPNRMQILIDGRSTYTNALSAIEWNALGVHIEDIERIEVVRSPSASAYGSNSYSGAINIVTKEPELDTKYQFRYRYGNAGENEYLLRHSGELNKLNYRFTAASRDSNGYENAVETRTKPETYIDDYRDNKDLNEFSLTARYRLSPTSSLWSNFSHTNSTVQSPNNILPSNNDVILDRDIKINGWSANLSWEKQLSDSKSFSVHFVHNYLDEDDMTFLHLADALIPPPATLAAIGESAQFIPVGERSFHSNRSDIEIEYTQHLDNGIQYIVGAGARYDTLKSDVFFPRRGEKSNSTLRVFSNARIPIHSLLSLNLGGLFEKSRLDNNKFSPRTSLNLHLSPLQSIRIGYSKAYRLPSLTEHNLDAEIISEKGVTLDKTFTRSKNLDAEKVTSIDISYLGQLKTQPISWEFRAYKEKYRNTLGFIIDETQRISFSGITIDPSVSLLDNAASSNMYGFEAELSYRPELNSFIRLNLNIGHMSGKRLHKIKVDGTHEYKDSSALSPQPVLGLLMGKQINSWTLNIAYYHVGNMEWLGAASGDQIKRYNRIDASISKAIALNQQLTLQLKFAGQNITNNQYNEFMIDTNLSFDPRYYASIALVHD